MRVLARAYLKSFQLKNVLDQTDQIEKTDILSFTTLRNERIRLPYFLDYYRELGVGHFFFVDNDSDDGGREYLCEQPDVSLWTTSASYKKSSFGIDWLNGLKRKHAHDHWVLVVDVDEFLIYPYFDTRPLPALVDWLEADGRQSFGAMMLDMYSKGDIAQNHYVEGADPIKSLPWFDAGNYYISHDAWYDNLWIQGGPRMREFFADDPASAPALNKTPLVKWKRGHAYISSTHSLLPRRLNRIFDREGGERTSGCLLHAKFLSVFAEKAAEEIVRGQHYANSREYLAYQKSTETGQQLWTPNSTEYEGWKQLEQIGLISTGGWL